MVSILHSANEAIIHAVPEATLEITPLSYLHLPQSIRKDVFFLLRGIYTDYLAISYNALQSHSSHIYPPTFVLPTKEKSTSDSICVIHRLIGAWSSSQQPGP